MTPWHTRARMIRRARHIDPMWDRNTRIARYLAARAGIHGTPFDHHDSTVDTARRPV
ncbi:hypothetical protein ABZ412_07695 [Nocardia sp. NPDC005746]|uniref:hypothetical protein n=1 Tax=unclassified Nocardia TaxID=2637762 RepID=UPI0033F9E9A4